MKYKIILALFCVLGLTCLFECFSPKIKASALYQRGDFGDENPVDIISLAQSTYDTYWNTSLNWSNFHHSFLTKNADNGYYYYYFGNWNNIDGVPRIYSNMPTGNDRVNINGDIGYIKFDLDGNYLSGMVYATGSSTYLYGWQETYYFSVSTTIQFNNGSWLFTPEEQYTNLYDATYYIGASGFNVQFAAYPNENSIYNGWWVETIDYKVQFQLSYNNQPIIVYPSGYKYYVMDILRTPASSTPSFLRENPYFNLDNRYHTIEYKVSDYGWLDSDHTEYIQSLNSPQIEYENTWYNPEEEFQTISLSDLLLYLQKDFPDMTFADLQQDITVSFIGADDNHTYYSNILRYSQVDFPDEAPPRDPEAPDWFSDLEDLVSQMKINQTYNFLSQLPPGYSPIRKVGSLGELDTISRPDFEYHEFEPDEDALDFFTWLVNLLFQSPFGLCFTICLGFLVVKAVFHND